MCFSFESRTGILNIASGFLVSCKRLSSEFSSALSKGSPNLVAYLNYLFSLSVPTTSVSHSISLKNK